MKKLLLLLALMGLGPPALAQVNGSITSAQCVTISVGSQSTVGIQVAGTWTGTLVPQISIQGQAPATLQVTPSTSATAQSTITANGVYQARVAGGSIFQVCGNTVATGTATVYLNASPGVAVLSGGSSGGGSPGSPDTSIQFRTNSTTFGGDANFVWDNTAKAVTLGPTTNQAYFNLLAAPRFYGEQTNSTTTGGSLGPFTFPFAFASFSSPAADSAIEDFTINTNFAVATGSTHNFTSELAGLHCEGDNNGSGTVFLLIGCAAEAYNLSTGTVTTQVGATSEVGSLATSSYGGTIPNYTNAIGTLAGFEGLLHVGGGAGKTTAVTNGFGFWAPTPTVAVGSTIGTFSAFRFDGACPAGITTCNGIDIQGTTLNNFGNGDSYAGALGFACPTISAPAAGPAWYCGTGGASGDRIVGSANGNDYFFFNMHNAVNTGTLNVGNLGGFTWSVGTANNLTADTGITRDSAAVVDVGNGTQGNQSGTVQATLFTGPITTSHANLGTLGVLTAPTYAFVNPGSDTRYPRSGLLMQAGNAVALAYDGVMGLGAFSTYTMVLDGSGWCWTSAISAFPDTCFFRTANGSAELSDAKTANSNGKFTAAAHIVGGTKYTTDGGCGETAPNTTGGATAGKYTTAGSTSCSSVITMGNTATAPSGWSCTAIDLTTLGDVTNPHQTATTTTTVTIASGTIVANDVIQFSCIGY